MVSIASIQTYKSLDPKEDLIFDLDAKIYETVLALRCLTNIKNKLTQIPNFIPNTLCSLLFKVTIKPTFPFPYFIHWVKKNDVKSISKILTSNGARIVCTINFE